MILSEILPQHTFENKYNIVKSQGSAGMQMLMSLIDVYVYIYYGECKIALDSFEKYVYSIAVSTHFFHTILRISAHHVTSQWPDYRYTVKQLC
jgi:hypothetical protein